ncbi:MAG TPA: L-2-hydroxyglutarate oxidase [Anaeromyxobacteraceae bacterium]|nr:L-2-hydroxyglutarate oxidase [Anaeromyxobacteraceae bacterium]
MAVDRADILLVGGGVIGLTLARELLARGAENVLVLEKEPDLGRHASGRNSGVLHAGIYYAPDSRKASTCLAGNRLMRAYCREKGLPLFESGKVVVARDETELPALDELARRARANGAPVEMLDERQLAEVEPSARTAGRALHSTLTAVVDPRAILVSLRADVEATGRARVRTGVEVLGASGSSAVRTTAGEVSFGKLVNAAGAHCDEVARHFGVGLHYRLIPFKGIYRKLRAGARLTVNGNIYPVPDPRNPFLGVHFTRSAHGDVYLGPTAIPAFGRENYRLFAGMGTEAPRIAVEDLVLFFRNPGFRSVALSEPRKYIPAFLHRDAARLVRAFDPAEVEPAEKVGIRPQLVDWRTKTLVMDFVVERAGDTVHVLNPVSPAFTSSMALARQIADDHFGRPS